MKRILLSHTRLLLFPSLRVQHDTASFRIQRNLLTQITLLVFSDPIESIPCASPETLRHPGFLSLSNAEPACNPTRLFNTIYLC